MKIIIDSDMIDKFFKSDNPSVSEILKNKFIKRMVRNCRIVGVYKDDMNANDLNNIVIKVIPSLKGKSNGK